MNAKYITVAALLALGCLAGCTKEEEGMGPAQKAGAAIDNVGQQAAEQMQDSLEKADEAAAALREKAKATGEQVKERAEDAARDADRGLEQITDNVGRSVEQAGEKIQKKAAD